MPRTRKRVHFIGGGMETFGVSLKLIRDFRQSRADQLLVDSLSEDLQVVPDDKAGVRWPHARGFGRTR